MKHYDPRADQNGNLLKPGAVVVYALDGAVHQGKIVPRPETGNNAPNGGYAIWVTYDDRRSFHPTNRIIRLNHGPTQAMVITSSK